MDKLYEKLKKEGVDPYKYKNEITVGFQGIAKTELEYLRKLETIMEKLLEENETLEIARESLRYSSRGLCKENERLIEENKRLKKEKEELVEYFGRDLLEERRLLAKENKEHKAEITALKTKIDALKSSQNLKDDMEKIYKKFRAALGGTFYE